MSLIVCNVPIVVSATIYSRMHNSHPANESPAISTFNMRFAKNGGLETDETDFGRTTIGGTNQNRNRNRNQSRGATMKVDKVDITTVTEVVVSSKEQPWTFMDDMDDEVMVDTRSSRDTVVKADSIV